MTETRPRAPRKDVARNRQRLLDAGREVFARDGLDATLDDVARHAGIGAGTAYRHFGSRQGLVVAIFSDAAQTFTLDAREALTADDPWDGLVTFVETFAGRQAADRGLHQLFTGDHAGLLAPEDWSDLLTAMAAVFDRAQAAGAVRADVALSDVVGLLATLGPVYDLSAASSTPIWRRYVDLFLRAVRTDAPGSVITTPPALATPVIAAAMST